MGQIALGRLANGTLEMNKNYSLCGENGNTHGIKLSALYTFQDLGKNQVERVYSGDIIALAGVDNIKIGDTISSNENPSVAPVRQR